MIEVRISPNWQAWVDGLNDIEDRMGRAAVPVFEQATRRFWSASQEVVHVVTGNLKRSGQYDVVAREGEVEASVSYGNEEVDYAAYEHARGGSHAYLTRAWEMTMDDFGDVLPQAWEAMVAQWR